MVNDKPSVKVNSNLNERKGKTQTQEDTGRKNKRKKSVCYPFADICLLCFLVFPPLTLLMSFHFHLRSAVC